MKVGPAPSNTNTTPCFDILPISSPVTCQDQARGVYDTHPWDQAFSSAKVYTTLLLKDNTFQQHFLVQ